MGSSTVLECCVVARTSQSLSSSDGRSVEETRQ